MLCPGLRHCYTVRFLRRRKVRIVKSFSCSLLPVDFAYCVYANQGKMQTSEWVGWFIWNSVLLDASIASSRCGLLLQMPHAAWSVCLSVCVSVCWSYIMSATYSVCLPPATENLSVLSLLPRHYTRLIDVISPDSSSWRHGWYTWTSLKILDWFFLLNLLVYCQCCHFPTRVEIIKCMSPRSLLSVCRTEHADLNSALGGAVLLRGKLFIHSFIYI